MVTLIIATNPLIATGILHGHTEILIGGDIPMGTGIIFMITMNIIMYSMVEEQVEQQM